MTTVAEDLRQWGEHGARNARPKAMRGRAKRTSSSTQFLAGITRSMPRRRKNLATGHYGQALHGT